MENDLIAKKWSYLYFFVSFVLFVYGTLSHYFLSTQFVYFVDFVYFCRTRDTVRHSETNYDTVRHSETKYDKVDTT
jgi:hypothetical protein